MYISEVQVSEALECISKMDMHEYFIYASFQTKSSRGQGVSFTGMVPITPSAVLIVEHVFFSTIFFFLSH